MGWWDRGDEVRLATLEDTLYFGLEILAEIVVLQVVNDADVVDVLAVGGYEPVSIDLLF